MFISYLQPEHSSKHFKKLFFYFYTVQVHSGPAPTVRPISVFPELVDGMSGPLEKGGCFAAKLGICGILCVSLIINQSQPLPKRRGAAPQSDWAKNKK
jgi:hypothetical protein